VEERQMGEGTELDAVRQTGILGESRLSHLW
jgi:hypothetical protein